MSLKGTVEAMTKICNPDGSEALSRESLEDLTSDPGLLKLLNCRSATEVQRIWLSRECLSEDLHIALLFQLIAHVSDLTSKLEMFLARVSLNNPKPQ